MKKEVLFIGAGISALTGAALLAKKGFKVTVVESQFKPGGSCGIFKRDDIIFEQGAAMIYGFGKIGFNPHRFVFNALEEPIDIIKHDYLYAIHFNGHKIIFYEDINKFVEQLGKIFPSEKDNFKRFYDDSADLYLKVIANQPTFTTPDVVTKEQGLMQLKSAPKAYLKFLGYMNKNTEHILKKYFKSKEVFDFFDKLTSTYCYTTVEETPAILSAVMFVDNHFGGSYYPAGSTLNLVGKLEKVIEENGGDMIYNRDVKKILVKDDKVYGVKLDNGEIINCERVVNSGNVWNLYNNLIDKSLCKKSREWANLLIPTYPSLVLFALVKDEVIPKDTLPIEMLIGDTEKIDEGEVTLYILSKDDYTLCPRGYQTVMAIGPSFKEWINPKGDYHTEKYFEQKQAEKNRILGLLEKRFPGFKNAATHVELSTPATLQRLVMKEKGAVAGPKQQLGQHMLKRLKTKGEIEGLYNCGESTVMGTGTPAVTVSGISAANLILRECKMQEYEAKYLTGDYVTIVKKPYTGKNLKLSPDETEDKIGKLSMKCQYCMSPKCEKACQKHVPIRDINRRLSVGNFYGARKILNQFDQNPCINCENTSCQEACIRNKFAESVNIKEINSNLVKK
ncbi:phytoene desaturase family protein [Intestinibacter bartlettii]|uniref:FAD-dependent oxidoreductase n=2 Tax=Intestinibacter bartlettii TaxID=261299 RepID=A0ABS6DVX4_9FIRM|nr:NAD(P)/FAD-dependent oxidoreductase [Intestinibacter bartlettii]MBU5335899.1 FAD-dependent oxidoreductase [Intestinibacter bartlettii]